MNLRIAICDDDKYFCDQLYQYAETAIRNIAKYSIDIFHDPDSFLKESKTVAYQLVFMDIDFNHRINGIGAAQTFRNNNLHAEIVFVSGYDNYALQLFEVSPFQFLIKPIVQEKVQELFDRYFRKHTKYQTFPYSNKLFPIPVSDITYLEYNNRRVSIYEIHEKNPVKEFRIYESFHQFCKGLEYYGFVQIQQYICINLNHVVQYYSNTVVLSNKETFTITPTYQHEFFLKYSRE